MGETRSIAIKGLLDHLYQQVYVQMAVRVQNYSECFKMFPESFESMIKLLKHKQNCWYSRHRITTGNIFGKKSFFGKSNLLTFLKI